jgi:thymidylate kinase
MTKRLKLIVFIGPDGCGKTTISELVGEQLRLPQEHRAANFEVMPTFSQMSHMFKNLLGGEKAKFVRNTDDYKGKHSGMTQKPNSIGKSIILVMWYTLDYILGNVLLARAKKTNTIFVFTRYYFDFYFQISNKNIPHYLLRFFEFFIPKPDIVFYLHQPAEDIYLRKPELFLKEIIRQQDIILSLAKERDYFQTVNAADGVCATVQKVLEKLERF